MKYTPLGAGSKRGRGGWGVPARSTVARGRALTGQQRPSKVRIPRAWGAEHERFASTHATQVQFGAPLDGGMPASRLRRPQAACDTG
eukprot:2622135-Pleurochrysis_carterae.AAC.1